MQRPHVSAARPTYRSALANLILKDFRVRYRNMSLGILWSLLNPLVMMGVLVVVFSVVLPEQGVPHFPVFLLIGLLAYSFLSQNLSSMTGCIVENESVLKKLYFPRYLLPLSILLSNGIHALIQLALLVLFIVVLGVPWSWSYLWYPLTWVALMCFSLGAGLWCATLCVFYRDTLYLVQSFLSVLFWLTPIFYSLGMVRDNAPAWAYRLYLLNPVAGLVDAGRAVILHGRSPDPLAFGTACAVSLAALLSGLLFFRRYQYRLSDRI